MRTSFCLGLLAFCAFFISLPSALSGSSEISTAARTKIKYLLPESSAAVFFSGNTIPISDSPEGASFLQLTGLNQHRSILFLFADEILYKGEMVTEILFIPNSGEWPAYWTETSTSFPEAQKISGIQSIAALDDLPILLEDIQRNSWVKQYLMTQFPAAQNLNPFNAPYEKALGNLRSKLNIPYAYSYEYSKLIQETGNTPSANFELIAQKGRNFMAYYPEYRQDSLINSIASIRSATDLSRLKSSLQNFQVNLTILPKLLAKLIDKKTPEEIAQFKSASMECARSLDEWLKVIEPEIYTSKLAAAWSLLSCKQAGCQTISAQVLTGTQLLSPMAFYPPSQLKTGELVRIKAGIRMQDYPIEIMRTLPVSGKYSPEQRTLLSIALKAQEAGLKKLKPGVQLSEVQEAMKSAIYTGLKETGIVRNENDLSKFIPESLVTHVTQSSQQQGSDEPLESGALLYLKPIICIYPQSPCPQTWWNLSIGISDPVMLSTSGAEFLEITLPRTATELESRVAETSILNQGIR